MAFFRRKSRQAADNDSDMGGSLAADDVAASFTPAGDKRTVRLKKLGSKSTSSVTSANGEFEKQNSISANHSPAPLEEKTKRAEEKAKRLRAASKEARKLKVGTKSSASSSVMKSPKKTPSASSSVVKMKKASKPPRKEKRNTGSDIVTSSVEKTRKKAPKDKKRRNSIVEENRDVTENRVHEAISRDPPGLRQEGDQSWGGNERKDEELETLGSATLGSLDTKTPPMTSQQLQALLDAEVKNQSGRERSNTQDDAKSFQVIDEDPDSINESVQPHEDKSGGSSSREREGKKSPRKRTRRAQRERERKTKSQERKKRPVSTPEGDRSFSESLRTLSVVSAQTTTTTSSKAHTATSSKEVKEANEDLLRSKHKKACNYLRSGALDGARKEFEEIAALLMAEYGDTHHRVGAAFHNIGIVHIRSGNFQDALDAIEEAVKIRKNALGRYHPKVADSLVELGITLLSMQEFEDSLDMFHEALEMRERDAEKTNSDKSYLQVAKVLNNIGCVFFEDGEYEEAHKTYSEALDIQREVIEGEDISLLVHPASLAMASTLCNIGFVHMENNEWANATSMFEEAAGIQQSVLEPGNKLLLNTLDNLGYSKIMYENYIGAIQTYKDMLAIQEQSLGEYHLDCSETRWKIVHAHLNLCEYDKALVHLKIIEEIQTNELGEDDEKVIKTRELVGWLRYEVLKYPSPIEILSRSLTTRELRNPFTDRLCCSCTSENISEVDLASLCEIPRPDTSSKMSGHKVSFA